MTETRLAAQFGHPARRRERADVDLIGVVNTVEASLAHIADHGSIIVTGSTAGLLKGTTDNPTYGPGGYGYGWSKRTLVALVPPGTQTWK